MAIPLLDQGKLNALSVEKRTLFIIKWLQSTQLLLSDANVDRAEVKARGAELETQLVQLLEQPHGPPIRKLVGKCLLGFYKVGDPLKMFPTLQKCIAIIKGGGAATGNLQPTTIIHGNQEKAQLVLAMKLGAIECVGYFFEDLGKFVGNLASETVTLFVKTFKYSSDALVRRVTLQSFQKIIDGLGPSGANLHKEIYKGLRNGFSDRDMSARYETAKCFHSIIKSSSMLYTFELEYLCNLCFKGLDGSNYIVRTCIAELLAEALENSLKEIPPQTGWLFTKKYVPISPDEMLRHLAEGFVKGNTNSGVASRQVRVGITHAYIALFKRFGPDWLEKNLLFVLHHLLALLAIPSITSSPTEAMYSRKCVSFIVESILKTNLDENERKQAITGLSKVVSKYCTSVDVAGSEHVLGCALEQMGYLIKSLGTPSDAFYDTLIEPLLKVLCYNSSTARLAAAWCFRCIAETVPSQTADYLTRCLKKLSETKSTPVGLHGYSYCIAALIGATRVSNLGIPHALPAAVLVAAEELLHTPPSQVQFSLVQISAGWSLLASLVSLGPAFVKSHLKRIFALWKEIFSKIPSEKECQKMADYDWHCLLQSRSSAANALYSFFLSIEKAETNDWTKRVVNILNSAVVAYSNTPAYVIDNPAYRHLLRSFKLRLFQCFVRIPANFYEASHTTLVRWLVSEFTLSETLADTSTSLLRSVCHEDEGIIGDWNQKNDQLAIEEQIDVVTAVGFGVWEHDPSIVYFPPPIDPFLCCQHPDIAIIDASVDLFAKIFPFLSQKHRHQLLAHFAACVNQGKRSPERQQALQVNFFTAFVSSVRELMSMRELLGKDKVLDVAKELILSALTNSDPVLRCAAGEALGRFANVVNEELIAEMVNTSIEHLKNDRDSVSRTGYSLALGCINRYSGGIVSGKTLKTTLGIFHALAGDNTPIVQLWSLHALWLTIEAAGLNFAPYVNQTLNLVLNLLCSDTHFSSEVHQCLGRIVHALISTIGPELQVNANFREMCLVFCEILKSDVYELVQLSALDCMQHMMLFTPQHIDLPSFLPYLVNKLSSRHFFMRNASVSCLKQLVQREPELVSAHGDGIEELLFKMLDFESDVDIIASIKALVTNLLRALGPSNPGKWLGLCKSVLSGPKKNKEQITATQEGDDDDDANELVKKTADPNQGTKASKTLDSGWKTKEFAVECVRKLIDDCALESDIHFDLVQVRKLQNSEDAGKYLVSHLSELIPTAFNAATSGVDQLRLVGLSSLQHIIEKFAQARDPDFLESALLEQYQAQFSAALRPAFSLETSPTIMAKACTVCGIWMSSGVSKDLNDLKRVQQLIVSLLDNMQDNSFSAYNECAVTIVRLSLLSAWSQLYVVYREDRNAQYLKDAIEPYLPQLYEQWLNVVRDYALICLPNPYASRAATIGTYFKPWAKDRVRKEYEEVWMNITLATALLTDTEFGHFLDTSKLPNVPDTGLVANDDFFIMLGLCMRSLSRRISGSDALFVLRILKINFAPTTLYVYGVRDPDSEPKTDKIRNPLSKQVTVELFLVFHRLIQTQDISVQNMAMSVILDLVRNATQLEPPSDDEDIANGKSPTYILMEVCACVLMRYFPSLNPQSKSKANAAKLTPEMIVLLSASLTALSLIPTVSHPSMCLQVVPSVLVLLCGMLRESAPELGNVIVRSFKTVFSIDTDQFSEEMASVWTKIGLCTLGTLCGVLEGFEKEPIKTVNLKPAIISFAIVASSLNVSPNKDTLMKRSLSLMQKFFARPEPGIRLTVSQSLCYLLQAPSLVITVPFVHELAPSIILEVHKASKMLPETEEETLVVLEGILLLEQLSSFATERQQLVGFQVPLLISLLSLAETENGKKIHYAALNSLTKIGPLYPVEFKNAVSSAPPEMKKKLETAIRENATKSKVSASHPKGENNITKRTPDTKPAAPSIQLRTDFSNFGKS